MNNIRTNAKNTRSKDGQNLSSLPSMGPYCYYCGKYSRNKNRNTIGGNLVFVYDLSKDLKHEVSVRWVNKTTGCARKRLTF